MLSKLHASAQHTGLGPILHAVLIIIIIEYGLLFVSLIILCCKIQKYRKFSNKGAGRGGEALEKRHFHLQVAFYRMKIGLFLAEMWPKTLKGLVPLGVKRGGAPL